MTRKEPSRSKPGATRKSLTRGPRMPNGVSPTADYERLRTELPDGRSQLTAIVLPAADHGLRVRAAAGDMPTFHSDYFPTVLAFLRKHLGLL